MTPSMPQSDDAATQPSLDASSAAAFTGDSDPNATSIWSSILLSVSSSKMVTTKNVLVLGDPASGKSTLIQALKRDHRETLALPANASSTAVGTGPSGGGSDAEQKLSELALSYAYADVKDDENEDTVGRLGFYQLSASHPTLMRFAFNANTLADTLILITVDWQQPWTFVETLQRWFQVIKEGVQAVCDEGRDRGASWSKGGVIVDEAKERLERFLQEYAEPMEDGSAPPNLTTNAGEVLLPLGEGTLTCNLGVPIAVVCCKADYMNILEKEHDYKDDQFDYIQQVLRTICLYYGASLFYTSTHRPRTTALLRSYLLNRLMDVSNSTTPGTPISSRFPFTYRAQIVDRDMIMTPSGWDSWGKVQILRDGFDCRQMADAWEIDEAKDERVEEHGMNTLYQRSVRDMTAAIKSVAVKELVEAEEEQEFLSKHLETLRRAGVADKPGAGVSGATSPSMVGSFSSAAAPGGTSPSLASGTLPPTSPVAAAPSSRGEVNGDPGSAGLTRSADASVSSNEDITARLARIAQSRTAAAAGTAGAAGAAGVAGAAAGNQSQNEVLASFFQSLLSKRATGAGGAAGATGGSSGAGSAAAAGAGGSSSSSSTSRTARRRAADELERMRQNNAASNSADNSASNSTA